MGGGFRVGLEVDRLSINNCRISDNNDIAINAVGDTLEVNNSTIINNGQGINASVRNLKITSSTISGNGQTGVFEDHVDGKMVITNTTIANNGGGGVYNDGSAASVRIINSTLSGNGVGIAGEGLQPAARIQNSIITGNGVDCLGVITSLGNNLFGGDKIGKGTTTCTDSNLLESDLVGNPGLGEFMDPGVPGDGHFPLLPESPAIDRGNDDVCPPSDQLGLARVDIPNVGTTICDIGAIEFFPVINNLISLDDLHTAIRTRPVPGGPAGTLMITATLTNTITVPISHLFLQVVELSGGNLLLNADGGRGGAGAILTPTIGDNIVSSGESVVVEFVVGLQTHNRFTFSFDIHGVSGE